MNNTLEMLVSMHKQMGKVIANEKAKNKAMTGKINLLKEVMTEEIVSDLKKLRNYHKELGIEKHMFKTNIFLESNKKRGGFVGITFIDNEASIELYNEKENGYIERCGLFKLDEEYDIKHWCFNCCEAIYSYWEDIKQNVEEQFIKAYFEEQKEICIQIGEERDKAINELTELLRIKGVLTISI